MSDHDSTQSSLGLLHSETLDDLSEMTLGSVDEVNHTPLEDFEPTPKAFTNRTPNQSGRLPSSLLGPSESTPNTPVNNPAVHKLLHSLVALASNESGDGSRLSWDKIFNNVKEGSSFCTGGFSARSTSFGVSSSSTVSGTEDDISTESSVVTNPEGEEFKTMDSNFFEQAEKENREKFRFIQEQTMASDVINATGLSKLGFANFSTINGSCVGDEPLSRSQYFLTNTSRLGTSLCNSEDSSKRPVLGFEAIKSPEVKRGVKPLLDHSVTPSSVASNSTLKSVETSVSKKLPFDSDAEKKLEDLLKSNIRSDGAIDLSVISMLINDNSAYSDDKKLSAEALVSMILKSIDGSNSPNESMENSCVSGNLPSFLDITKDKFKVPHLPSSTSNFKSNSTIPKIQSKRKSINTRHSSPIRPKNQLKIQPIDSVIKSSKILEDEPNVSIVVMDGLKHSDSLLQLRILTKEGDKIDFGTLPEDCSTTEDLVLVHDGKEDHEICLEIQGQLPSFLYPTDGQTKYVKMISSKQMLLTLPAITTSGSESVACNIKISIHTPSSNEKKIKLLRSQINVLWSGKLLAQVPMIARVGQAKLQTLKSNKLPVLRCSLDGSWIDHIIPMMNFGNVPMHLTLIISPESSLGLFEIESPIIIQPNTERKTKIKFLPKISGEMTETLKCTVQPNGTTYEVPVQIICSPQESTIQLPSVKFGKLREPEIITKIESDPVNFVFPIEADKSYLTYYSVISGSIDEQSLVLKNAVNDPVNVSLSIRDSECFKISLSESSNDFCSSVQTDIAVNSTKIIRVRFEAPEHVQMCTGKLIIKPPGLSKKGKAYKATIGLQAYVGAPELLFSGFGEEYGGREGKRSLFLGSHCFGTIRRTLTVKNKGTCFGFVCIFSKDSDIKCTPDKVVIAPDSCQNFELFLNLNPSDRNSSFNYELSVYYGSELTRSALKKYGKVGFLKESIPEVDFLSSFSGDTNIPFPGVVGAQDVKYFYKYMNNFTVNLNGSYDLLNETSVKFNALNVEETLSESRLDSTNSTLHPKNKYLPIKEEEEKLLSINPEEVILESGKTSIVNLKNNRCKTPIKFDLGWPAHIFSVSPSSGNLSLGESIQITLSAECSEKKKTNLTIYPNGGDAILLNVILVPIPFVIEPDKVKFLHPGTKIEATLKNRSDRSIVWSTSDSDANFLLAKTKGSLLPNSEIKFDVTYTPKQGIPVEKSYLFSGLMDGQKVSALLEISGGQDDHQPTAVSGSKKSVYLDKESISFPSTNIGEVSTVKVIVKNRLNTAQVFNVEALSKPFSTKFVDTPIVVNPMSYLGFPVSFSPSSSGFFKTNIVLKNNQKVLVGTLVGTSS